MPPQVTSTLNPIDRTKFKNAPRARIYYAYGGTKKWSYAGLQGALVFVLNTSNNSPHFQMLDLDGTAGVIWDYKLHDGLVLDQDKGVTFFLSFEGDIGGDRCTIGFVFEEDLEAKSFYNRVNNNRDIKSPKPKLPSWMRSISRASNIDKSMISSPKEGGFVHVAHMGYDTGSGFTSKGVDASWTALLEGLHGYLGKKVVDEDVDFIKDFIQNYSERKQNQMGFANRPPTPPPPPPPARTRSLNSSSIPPPSRPVARRLGPPQREFSPVVEDDQSAPPPPPRRLTPPTRGPPPPLERPLPPRPGDIPSSQDMKATSTTKEMHHSLPRYSASPPPPVSLSHSISRNRSTSPSVVLPRSTSSSSTIMPVTPIRRQGSQRSRDVRLVPHEVINEDEPEAEPEPPKPNVTETVQPPSQPSQQSTAPWIIAACIPHPHVPRKPVDVHFNACMADIRRHTSNSEGSSSGSTGVSFIVPRVSVTSSAFSQSHSVTSVPPPVVEFPPTPVFKDEVPKAIMGRKRSLGELSRPDSWVKV